MHHCKAMLFRPDAGLLERAGNMRGWYQTSSPAQNVQARLRWAAICAIVQAENPSEIIP
jgi:hypothetical protein